MQQSFSPQPRYYTDWAAPLSTLSITKHNNNNTKHHSVLILLHEHSCLIAFLIQHQEFFSATFSPNTKASHMKTIKKFRAAIFAHCASIMKPAFPEVPYTVCTSSPGRRTTVLTGALGGVSTSCHFYSFHLTYPHISVQTMFRHSTLRCLTTMSPNTDKTSSLCSSALLVTTELPNIPYLWAKF
jgi:hypothetical protein